MFSWERTRRFLVNALLIAIPFLLLDLAFGLLSETASRKEPFGEAVRTGQFWLEVILALLPMIAAMALALWFAGRFLRGVYRLDGMRQAIDFLLSSRCDLRSFGPWVRLKNGALDEEGAGILDKVGGPGHLVIYNDSAAVLEKGGRFTRAIGAVLPESEETGYPEDAPAGFARLAPFEKVYDVVDLRPKRAVHRVVAMTREGIRVEWDVELRYQIDNADEVATEGRPYPLSPSRVLLAATSRMVHHLDGAETLDWEDRLFKIETERHLRPILARHSLDQLIGFTDTDEEKARLAAHQAARESALELALETANTAASEEDREAAREVALGLTSQKAREQARQAAREAAREAVRCELEERLRQAAPKVGAKILQVRLDNLRVDSAITEQWVNTWRARWQNWSAGQLAQAEASYVHLYEFAKAEAQMQMITKIARELQKHLASRTIPSQAVPQMVLMRLFSVLDRADFAPNSRVFFPTQTMDALDGIQRALNPGQTAETASIILIPGAPTVARGGQVQLDVIVQDVWRNPVLDGTVVRFSTNSGTMVPESAITTNGRASAQLVAGDQPGEVEVTVQSGSGSGTTKVQII